MGFCWLSSETSAEEFGEITKETVLFKHYTDETTTSVYRYFLDSRLAGPKIFNLAT